MVIQHNMSALNALRHTGINNQGTKKNLEKLSSGFKVNQAADDAAGLAISEKMRGQIRGLSMATQNASNGISLIQTAEGGMNETHAILHRLRELAVQSANGTYDDVIDRVNLDKEVQALKREIDRIASSTNYNGISLLDGTLGGGGLSALPAKPGTAGIAPEGYYSGSVAALGAYLADLGFPLDTAPGANGLSILGNISLTSYDSSFDGQSANIVISSGMPALQVGDKTYTFVYHDTPKTYDVKGTAVTVDRAYAFVDENDNLVAELDCGGKVTGNGEITGNRDAIIKGIPLGQSSTVTKIFTEVTDPGDKYLPPGDPMYDAMLGDERSRLILQIGANGTADQRVGLHVGNMSTAGLGDHIPTYYNPSGSVAGIKVNPREAANDAISVIDTAINQASETRATLGSLQNRLEHTINNLGVTRENLQQAESLIRDVDMAKEMMDFTKNNILNQASQAMLAQSNQLPQGVLQLLR